jgi:hypothetical protein
MPFSMQSSKIAFTVGVDAGAEQKAKGSKQYNAWYSPVFIVRYAPIEMLALSARVEYYSDKNSVIVATGTPNGFQTFGYSLKCRCNAFSECNDQIGRKIITKQKRRNF